jgi:hypothetical protein
MKWFPRGLGSSKFQCSKMLGKEVPGVYATLGPFEFKASPRLASPHLDSFRYRIVNQRSLSKRHWSKQSFHTARRPNAK